MIKKLLASGLLTFLLLSMTAINSITPALATIGPGDTLGLSPFWAYKTIETDHFRITFPEELTETAQKVANYLEEAHRLESPRLFWEANYRANILVIDNQDSENGLTTAEARFGIALYVTPPDNWESIYYYDNWLRELCLHEYTHFLNMDSTTSFYKPLRYIFGDTLLPNTLWPTWMLEGLAVYMETRLTKAGRGRSPYYEMILRAAVEEGVLDTSKFLTLSKINGPDPYYPGGEIAYLFGYQLMNQVSRTTPAGPTADMHSTTKGGDFVLGEMSIRSSARIPFFINGNLENISGKSWYNQWDDFIVATRARVGQELKTIRAQAVTKFKRLTTDGYLVRGPRYSPDRHWLAWSADTLNDESFQLYVKDLKTGKLRHVLDKENGATVSFTSDSKHLFLSRLHRIKTYYLYTDLEVYDLEQDRHYWISDTLRARDPSVSPDSKWLTFAITEDNTTKLAIAELNQVDGKFEMGKPKILFAGEKFDRSATPQFSPDGSKIAFSLHKNGDVGEEIRVYDLKSQTTQTLVTNGHFNRFPAWDPSGQLYFVSDLTGVDNLYKVRSGTTPEMLSNLETGLMFPYFYGSNQKYLASVFSTRGYDLAEVDLPKSAYNSAQLRMPDVPAPPVLTAEESKAEPEKKYDVNGYSIWPTILPRIWSPILVVDQNGTYTGGTVTGFDQTDRQRYLLLGAYDSFVSKPDALLHYENRMFGPTLEGSASWYTNSEGANGNQLTFFERQEEFSGDIYFPFQFTYSSLTPIIAFDEQRDFLYDGNGNQLAKGTWVPHVQGLVAYSDEENSRVAIAPESGRYLTAGARVYLNNGVNTWKGLVTDQEHFEFGNSHVVLIPSFKGTMSSNFTGYAPANVLVQGRFSGQVINSLAADNFDQIAIRGYPLQAFYTRAATQYAMDLDFPIYRIFDGLGTDPVYLNYLYGFVFGEATYFPAGDILPSVLPSAGGGVRLTTQLLNYVPVTFSVEYANGFQQSAGGGGQVFFQALAQAIAF